MKNISKSFLLSVMSVCMGISLVNADGLSNFYTKFELGKAKPTELKNRDVSKENVGDYNPYKKAPSSSLTYGVGLGYQFNNKFRTDLTITQFKKFNYQASANTEIRKSNITQSFNGTAAIVNAYYTEDKFSDIIRPFVGFGVGVASVKAGDVEQSISNSSRSIKINYPGSRKVNFAWNVNLGVSLIYTERINLDIFYRYMNLGKASTGKSSDGIYEPFESKLKVNSAGIALRLKY